MHTDGWSDGRMGGWICITDDCVYRPIFCCVWHDYCGGKEVLLPTSLNIRREGELGLTQVGQWNHNACMVDETLHQE